MNVRIEVTAADIANGKPKKQCACPVALALRRHGLGETASVGLRFARVRVGGGFPFACLPPEAVAFVKAFDAGLPVAPFAFDLDVPGPPESP